MRESAKSRLRQLSKVLRGRMLALVLIGTATVWVYTYYITSMNLFVIMDGDKLTLHETYTQNAEDALREAGITISRYDSVSLPDGPLQGGAAEVVIQRNQTVTLLFDGRELRISTHGEDVNAVLERAGVVLGPKDAVTPGLGAPAVDGLVIEVVRRDILTERVAEEIPYEQQRVETSERLEGQEVLTVPGATGELLVFYEVTLEEGVEVSRRVTGSVVTVEPVNEVWEIGTGRLVTKLPAPKPTPKPERLVEASPGTLTMPDGTVVTYANVLDVTATAYTTEGRTQKRNALGKVARVGTIAVDPKVIPLRSKVYIEAEDGTWVYGIAVCEDTGGVIKGNKIDLYFDTRTECFTFGVKKAKIYILD